jgi:hypothetical protein
MNPANMQCLVAFPDWLVWGFCLEFAGPEGEENMMTGMWSWTSVAFEQRHVKVSEVGAGIKYMCHATNLLRD